MHEVGRRAGAGECRSDLARDVPGLADAADDDAAMAVQDESECREEGAVDAVDQGGDGIRLDAQDPSGQFERFRRGVIWFMELMRL